MTRYIAFLRAINVGGHFVKMDVLRQEFENLGFHKVQTYIQSGNVFFNTEETNTEKLEEQIALHLYTVLGYEVATFVRQPSELEKRLQHHPFSLESVDEFTRHCVVFLSLPLAVELPHVSSKKEIILEKAIDKDLFATYYIQNGKTPSLGGYIEKLGKVKATVRFFSTTQKIVEAARIE